VDETATPSEKPPDPELVATGLRHLETARGQHGAGSLQDALLGYAAAATIFDRAGASRELAEVELLVAPLAAQCGDLSFSDLLPLDDAARQRVCGVMARSQQLLAEDHCIAAIDECLSGIALVPQYLPLQERLGEAQARIGAVSDALARFISVLELYLLRGQQARAEAVLDKAAALAIGEKQLCEELVSAILDAGLWEGITPRALAFAERMLEEGYAAEAARLLQAVVSLAPQEPSAMVRWGKALESLGRQTEALRAYTKALAIDRSHWEAALHLSVAASLAGSFDTVEDGLGILLEMAVDHGDIAAAALDRYASALTEHPDCMEVRWCLGVLLAQVGKLDEAAPHLRKAAAGSGRLAALARLWLGRFSLEQETVDAAIRHLAAAQRLISEAGPAERGNWRLVTIGFQRLWGEVCLRRGDLEKAVPALQEVKRLAPRDSQVYTLLAEVHFRKGDQASAVAELVALGDLHVREHQLERALNVFHGAVQIVPDDPAPRVKLADTYLALNRLQDALTAMSGLADVLADKGQREEATVVLRRMVEQCRESDPARALALRVRIARLLPLDADARQQLIAAYLAAGNADAALAEANQLWRDMLEADRRQEAAAALQQILQVDPWNTEALIALADLQEHMGERSLAIETYRRALATDAANAQAAARLAVLAGSDIEAE
jgi:tetratricopeptide (TPR) repeat protein